MKYLTALKFTFLIAGALLSLFICFILSPFSIANSLLKYAVVVCNKNNETI